MTCTEIPDCLDINLHLFLWKNLSWIFLRYIRIVRLQSHFIVWLQSSTLFSLDCFTGLFIHCNAFYLPVKLKYILNKKCESHIILKQICDYFFFWGNKCKFIKYLWLLKKLQISYTTTTFGYILMYGDKSNFEISFLKNIWFLNKEMSWIKEDCIYSSYIFSSLLPVRYNLYGNTNVFNW